MRPAPQTVTTAPTSLALGVQRWPHADDAPVVRTVTYRNGGAAGVTPTVRVEATGPGGRPAPAGMFTASPRP